MTSPREASWRAEDESEGLDVSGTRHDIGMSSEDRAARMPPPDDGSRGLAASLSEAAVDTSVQDDTAPTATSTTPDEHD